MSLPVLAFFTRALRSDNRSLRTYLFRMLFVFVLLMQLFVFQQEEMRLSAPGLSFFGVMMPINLVFLCLIGLSHFASAITEEKEEMTLGLLKMSSLNPVSILLGKSASRVLTFMLIIMVQFPFILLGITLGGVSFRQIAAAYATLIAFAVFLGGLGLLCSVVFSTTEHATGAAGLLLLGFLLSAPLGRGVLQAGSDLNWWALPPAWSESAKTALDLLGGLSPFTRVKEIMATGYSGRVVGFQVIGDVLTGVLMFVLAWVLFEVVTREAKEAAPSRGLVSRRRKGVRLFSAGRVWQSAIQWKEYNFVAGGGAGLILRFLIYSAILAVLVLATANGRRPDFSAIGIGLMVLMPFLAYLEIVSFLNRTVQQEVKWGTFPALSVLPLSFGEIMLQKAVTLRFVLLPTAAFFLLGAVLAPGPLFDTVVRTPEMGFLFAASEAVLFVYVVLFFAATVRRASFVLAVVACGVFNSIAWPFMVILFGGVGERKEFLFFQTAVAALLIVRLHFAFFRRLRILSAE